MLLWALAAGFPGVVVAIYFLWTAASVGESLRWTLTLVIVGVWWFCAAVIQQRVASPLRTLANLLEAMREGDC